MKSPSIVFTLLALIGFTAVSFPGPALAQGTERLGDFGDWSAFRFQENGEVACYMASEPKKAEGNYQSRGDIFAVVTHRPAEKTRDEVSILAGYTYEKGSSVEVQIGAKKLTLFTDQDAAWAADAATDAELVKAMVKGSKMVVRGTSSRGTPTTDSYSLSGFTKARNAIDKACPKK